MTRAFYSFHFDNDVARAGQVRNMGVVDGDQVVDDNSWEKVKRAGDHAIQTWIDDQMARCDVVIVLVGSQTASRKWINYEICRAWDTYKPVFGIRIHGLKNFQGLTSQMGENPFDKLTVGNAPMSNYVPLRMPNGLDSKGIYADIERNIQNWIRSAPARSRG
ncbi:TIR domain-containing protein [Achromobacter insuavis]|uniref:TIR domain-containing protein n=1 Tax=Achromobacter insuavis TaxID=1287735 RepID=UPI002402CCAC|nr:TIR domain-containing protein [Achromobacter insuavis]